MFQRLSLGRGKAALAGRRNVGAADTLLANVVNA